MKNIFLLFCLCISNILFAQQTNQISFTNTANTYAVLNSNFTNYSIVQLNPEAEFAIGNNQNIDILVNNNSYNFTMIESKIFASNYKVSIKTNTGLQQKTLADLNFDGLYFQGNASTVGNKMGLSFFNNQLEIYIETPLQKFYIEPLNKYISNAATNLYVYYQAADVISQNANCGTTQASTNNIPQAQGLAGACLQTELAIACDYSMYTKYGNINSVINRTVSITNLTNTDYRVTNSLVDDIKFRIVEHYIVTCDSCNPWPSTTNINDNLDSITNNGTSLFLNTYDLAQYWFNNPTFGGGTVGLAWVGAVCTGFRYNAILDYSTNSSNMRNLNSHEIGHNFDCNHDAAGSGFIMAPSVNGSTTWSTASINSISAYTTSVTCLAACPATTLCDTLGINITNLIKDTINGKVTIKIIPTNGVSYKARLYNFTSGTWTAYQTFAFPTDSTFFNIASTVCSGIFKIEIAPVCPVNITGASKQIVFNYKKIISVNIAASPNDTVCAGTPLTLTASGGTTYTWSGGGITNGTAFTPVSNTTYTVTASGGAACSATKTIAIVVAPIPTIGISVTPNNSVCAGTPTTITATSTGTIVWTGGITNGVAFSPTATTTYTVTSTSAAGCTKTATQTITVNTSPTLAIAVTPNDTVCTGTSVTLSATGANTYAWNGGITNGVAFTPTATTTYTVTGTNANGCTKTKTQTIVVAPIPTIGITVSPNNSVCAGTPTTITATSTGTIVWTGGITNGVAFSPTATTTYTVTSTSAAGCTKTATQTITVNASPTVAIAVTPNDTVCTATNVTLTATGANTYAWSGGIANGVAFTPITTTAYTVTGTNANGCTKTKTQTIVVAPIPTIGISVTPNDSVCAGTPTIITATSTGTISWTGGITNGVSFSPTATTTYTVTSTSAAGCTKTATQTITVNASPTIAIAVTPNDTVCTGTNVTLTATGANTYAWSGGITNGVAFTPTATTTYTVTGTNANGCTKTKTQTIVVAPIPTIGISITPNDSVCAGTSITITATSTGTIVWTGGITNGVAFTPTATTTYTVTSTSAAGCTKTATQTITVNTSPTVAIAVTPNDTVCTGTSVTLSATGANTYAWSGGIANGVAFTPTATTTYTVTGTNANGCTKTQTQTIVVAPIPTIGITVTPNDSVCAGTSTIITATSTGAIAWSGGITNGIAFTPTATTTYTVTSTSAAGCTKTATQLIVVNNLPTINISITPNNTVCAGSNITITATGANTYVWSNGITNGVAFASTNTNIYTVTATSINNCTTTGTQNVIVNNSPNLSIATSPNDTICEGDNITLTASGAASYNWSGGVTNGVAFAPPVSATYTVSATNTNGCSSNITQLVTVLPSTAATISLQQTPLNVINGQLVTFTASINPATLTNYSLQWFVNGAFFASTNSPTNFISYTISDGFDAVYAKLIPTAGCYNPDTAISSTVIVRNITPINSINANLNLSIYPNPTKNILYIKHDGIYTNKQIKITNNIGQTLLQQNSYNKVTEINTSSFSDGVYFLYVQINGEQHIQKIIIHK